MLLQHLAERTQLGLSLCSEAGRSQHRHPQQVLMHNFRLQKVEPCATHTAGQIRPQCLCSDSFASTTARIARQRLMQESVSEQPRRTCCRPHPPVFRRF